MRRNPLTSFAMKSSRKIKDVDYVFAPLMKEDAAEKHAEGMRTMDRVLTAKGLPTFNLAVLVDEVTPEKFPLYRQLALEENCLLYIYDLEKTERKNAPYGDPMRETPYTFFNQIHKIADDFALEGASNYLRVRFFGEESATQVKGIRLGPPIPSGKAWREGGYGAVLNLMDISVSTALLEYEDFLEASWAEFCKNEHCDAQQLEKQVLNFGLNTKAGRIGALANFTQTFADFFAKYCLSMDTAYDTETPFPNEKFDAFMVRKIDSVRYQPNEPTWSLKLSFMSPTTTWRQIRLVLMEAGARSMIYCIAAYLRSVRLPVPSPPKRARRNESTNKVKSSFPLSGSFIDRQFRLLENNSAQNLFTSKDVLRAHQWSCLNDFDSTFRGYPNTLFQFATGSRVQDFWSGYKAWGKARLEKELDILKVRLEAQYVPKNTIQSVLLDIKGQVNRAPHSDLLPLICVKP